ncbi:hypothetical protein [Comamonas koreensis]|uniref:Uncharacterized protein n=1 Tax=Comamonas koreensis TaxID=160825 RepID=A0AAW4XZW4_9BURK|nr:hypothetical protein [Comamonas koreensis]MCD2167757.1 hypothetical protein [Comamonas koreensis]
MKNKKTKEGSIQGSYCMARIDELHAHYADALGGSSVVFTKLSVSVM